MYRVKAPEGMNVVEEPEPDLAVYLGQRTFDGNYTCSMVHYVNWSSSLPQPRPVQSDLIKKVAPEEIN